MLIAQFIIVFVGNIFFFNNFLQFIIHFIG